MTQEAYRLQRSVENLNPTEANPTTGWLGTILGGVYTIVARDPSKFYVRFPDHRFVDALHKGRVRAMGSFAQSVEVELFVNERNQWEIKGIAPAQGGAVEEVFGSEVYVPEHSHSITDMAWIGDKTLTSGNILVADGVRFNSEAPTTIFDLILTDDDGNVLTDDDGNVLLGD